MIRFELNHTSSDCQARAGLIVTDHGPIQTPIFMPVGTQATVKGVHVKELKEEIKAQIILSNTYHLFLRPGEGIIHGAGGLHKFMDWDGPILTDSGGYQVFSLSDRRIVKKEGVYFSSHIDGSRHLFTPQSVVQTQRILGSDIMMALDECPAYPSSRQAVSKSLKITNSWLEEGIRNFEDTKPQYDHDQIFVPISQGSVYDDLRRESTLFNAQFNTPVQAIGGLSVGEPHEELYRMARLCTELMPTHSARYLMGVGTPVNLLNCIEAGIDMFDCVLPTRNARHGILYTSEGIINIRNKKWAQDFTPIDPNSACSVSRRNTKSYLRHLFVAGELLAGQIASLQNLSFYLDLVKASRDHIVQNNFMSWKTETIQKISQRL
ncbi:MAG TPA: tRNA guanosine(34) transglycosylase Tgt [Saprospiraceae bacterium]|nr:tRNA guanosine(34) transglycosylase Tgt [Saprospiraceae bacterium]HMX88547.1 tRNA guanosine(34) transglycosylase Tgt [Saprospiraceae bacterium]HMZ40556.1 tRNA guanosine(34) transglycosylase Tgt [Saprospiraceae bacterium]HNA64101.1 tRNA guanosine(34) transglycosylase Tgt [Saprospiraceae bacterium]HNB29939.1 tRNA guanosine(34) transglycosylase Tgt [Saprospiraceae bacterium]